MINFVDVAMSPTPMCSSCKSHMLQSFLHYLLFQNIPGYYMVILNFIATVLVNTTPLDPEANHDITPIAVVVPVAILCCIGAVIVCLIVSIIFRRIRRKGGMLTEFFFFLLRIY